MDNAEVNDIDFSPTPAGFILKASLSSYWSVPMIVFVIVWTSGFAYGFSQNWLRMSIAFQVAGVSFVTGIGGIFWWMALLRAFGTQSVVFDSPYLEVGVGVGSLRFTYRFDTRDIASIVEAEGTISGGENTRPYRAILLTFTRPIDGRIFNRSKFAFGHFMTVAQRRFVINRLQEAMRVAA